MSDTSLSPEVAEVSRPTGLLAPCHEAAVRTLAAIRSRRLDDALRHLSAIPPSPFEQAAWKDLLSGWIDVERGHTADAEPSLHRAIALSWVGGLTATGLIATDFMRLAALGLHLWGRILRRQDRADCALAIHEAAHRLREQFGSFDEVTETAIEIGLDLVIVSDHGQAMVWFDRAVDCARRSDEGMLEAAAHTHRSTSLVELGRFEQAVKAAREAQSLFHRHDSGSSSCALADARLAAVMLKHALALHETGDDRAAALLDDSIIQLQRAEEDLSAFGADFADDIHWCREQLQFAKSLVIQVSIP